LLGISEICNRVSEGLSILVYRVDFSMGSLLGIRAKEVLRKDSINVNREKELKSYI
jgi:hypothetical protein